MNKTTIKATLEQAIANLFWNQPNIFDFTPESIPTEWNLAHHLSFEVHKFFPWFDCDLEIIKTDHERKRPDIILHKRGTHRFNFLVIEVKRDSSDELEEVIKRIRDEWFQVPERYQFGAAVNLDADKSYRVDVIRSPLQSERPTQE